MENNMEQLPGDGWLPADLGAMAAIWNEIVRAGKAFPQENELDEKEAEEFFRSQSHCGVVRDEGGEVLGFYILHPNNIGRCGHICNASYAVKKTERGRGLGKRLVLASLAAARMLGFRIIQFNAVVESNSPAHRLYRSLGFTELGKIPGGFRPPDGECEDIRLYWRAL